MVVVKNPPPNQTKFRRSDTPLEPGNALSSRIQTGTLSQPNSGKSLMHYFFQQNYFPIKVGFIFIFELLPCSCYCFWDVFCPSGPRPDNYVRTYAPRKGVRFPGVLWRGTYATCRAHVQNRKWTWSAAL